MTPELLVVLIFLNLHEIKLVYIDTGGFSIPLMFLITFIEDY